MCKRIWKLIGGWAERGHTHEIRDDDSAILGQWEAQGGDQGRGGYKERIWSQRAASLELELGEVIKQSEKEAAGLVVCLSIGSASCELFFGHV